MRDELKEIKWVPIKDVKPNEKNRNKHPKEQIDRLAMIIDRHGWRHPLVVSEQSGLLVIGHGRLEAAKKLKLKEVPVMVQKFNSPEEEFEVAVADNAIPAWAELDLAGIQLDLPDFDPTLLNLDALGLRDFRFEPLDKIAMCDEDAIPEKVEPRTKLGDLYTLGEHRLLCGDSTNLQQVEMLMDGEKADIAFTSPPYNAGRAPMKSEREKPGKQDNKYNQYKDDGDASVWKQLISDSLISSMTVSSIQLFNVQHLAGNKIALIEWLNEFKLRLVDTVIWDKQHGIPNMADNVLNSRFEYVFIFSEKDNPTRGIPNANFSRDLDNVYSAPRQTKNEFSKIHAATFPVHFPEHFVSKFSKVNGLIFDPFGGTGTTLIACEKHHRRCFMMELDPHYCDVIVARWEKYTGKKAILNDSTT